MNVNISGHTVVVAFRGAVLHHGRHARKSLCGGWGFPNWRSLPDFASTACFPFGASTGKQPTKKSPVKRLLGKELVLHNLHRERGNRALVIVL